MFRLSRFVFVCVPALAAAASSAPAPAIAQANAALAGLPLRFEANLGQTGPAVRFTAHAKGYTLELTGEGATLRAPGSRPVAISLLDSNRSAPVDGLERLPVRTDYFVGSRERWHSAVPTYSRVRYRGVYPGIDLVYYGNQKELEYDFVLAPGADPRSIRMKFGGAGRVRISPEGDLLLGSAGEGFIQKKPVIYQEDASAEGRRIVAGRYVLLSRGVVGLRLDGYDRSRRLVIDPSITYCTYLGGSGADQINAVKLGPNNRLYVVGQTDSSQIAGTDGAYLAASAGLLDAFLAIIDTTPGRGLPLVYFSYLGGTNSDVALGLDVDWKGIAYITGGTNSSDFPAYGGFLIELTSGSTDAFVAMLDPSVYGTDALIFSSYLGGSGIDVGNGIVADPSGRIDVIGTTQSTDFPVTSTAKQPVLWGSQDIFICQIDAFASASAGAITYATYLGGEDRDYGVAIAVDARGLVYFVGNTLSTEFPVAGYNFKGTPSGGGDVVVGVMDLTQTGDLSQAYTAYLGGSGYDEALALAFDGQGNLLVTGLTLSGDFPVTRDAFQSSYGGNSDGFVAVLNPSIPFGGGLIYATYLGGARGDSGRAIGADVAGNLYVSGYTLSSNFPVKNAVQDTWGGGTNVFLIKFRPGTAGSAAVGYSTYVGTTATYVPTGLALGADGTAYVVGYGYVGLPSSAEALQGGFAGGASDGFLVVVAQ